MGEELSLFGVEFNGSLRVEARAERLTGEAGTVILREVIERLGIGRYLAERLDDPRNPDLITHPLVELLHTESLMLGQGWRDRDDADVLRDDPAMRLSVSTRRGVSPLETRPGDEPKSKNPPVPDGLASQPTLSRLGGTIATEKNRAVLRESLLVTAARRIKAGRGGHRMRYATLDVDSLPIEVHGHQEGSEYNGHYHARISILSSRPSPRPATSSTCGCARGTRTRPRVRWRSSSVARPRGEGAVPGGAVRDRRGLPGGGVARWAGAARDTVRGPGQEQRSARWHGRTVSAASTRATTDGASRLVSRDELRRSEFGPTPGAWCSSCSNVRTTSSCTTSGSSRTGARPRCPRATCLTSTASAGPQRGTSAS